MIDRLESLRSPWLLRLISWIIISNRVLDIEFCGVHFGGSEDDEHDAFLRSELRVYGTGRYFSVVAAAVTDSMAAQFVCPMAGTCCSEYGRNSGFSALISYDDLSKHAVAYRQLSLFCESRRVERLIRLTFLPAFSIVGAILLFELLRWLWFDCLFADHRDACKRFVCVRRD